MDWPDTGEQVGAWKRRSRSWIGCSTASASTTTARFFRTKAAYLHTRGERRPPIYVSAFGPDAAGVAARLGDGLWTLADPESAPELIDAYRGACDDAGQGAGRDHPSDGVLLGRG